jgi:hypothetical protein
MNKGCQEIIEETIHRYQYTDQAIDIKSLPNRMLKVCYVPVTGASLSRLLFLIFAVAINSTNEANKAGGTCL